VVKLVSIIEKLLLMRSHFLPSDKITALFANQKCQIRVISVEFNVWVCVEKVREM
jgi:hypothetical protein